VFHTSGFGTNFPSPVWLNVSKDLPLSAFHKGNWDSWGGWKRGSSVSHAKCCKGSVCTERPVDHREHTGLTAAPLPHAPESWDASSSSKPRAILPVARFSTASNVPKGSPPPAPITCPKPRGSTDCATLKLGCHFSRNSAPAWRLFSSNTAARACTSSGQCFWTSVRPGICAARCPAVCARSPTP